MTKHKRLINKWLHEFTAVMCELSDTNFRFAIESGRGVMFAPDDIFQTLKRRSVIEFNGRENFYFFIYPCDAGQPIVKIEPLSTLQKGLILSVQNDDKKPPTN